MRKSAFVMILALTASAWTCAQAGDRTWGDGTLPEHLAIYDVDGDGTLSVEEIQAMERARAERHGDWLQAWDTNGDGVIDEAEKAAAQEAMRDRITQTRTNRFNEADSDGDGCLTFEEFSAIPAVAELAEHHPDGPARVYGRLDANDDNCVSVEEFTARLRHRRDDWRTDAVYLAADVDADRCLTLEEFSSISNVVRMAQHEPAEPARLYARLDVNDDSCLSLEEFKADIHLGEPRDGWRIAGVFIAADVNADRCLSLREFSAIPAVAQLAARDLAEPPRLYARLDVDHNGCLTLAEFTAPLGEREGPDGPGGLEGPGGRDEPPR